MTTALDTVRNDCGMAGEEVADMVDTLEQQLEASQKREVLLREFVMEWLDRQGTDENYMVQKAKEALSATEPKGQEK